jgi:hypothetical protein
MVNELHTSNLIIIKKKKNDQAKGRMHHPTTNTS